MSFINIGWNRISHYYIKVISIKLGGYVSFTFGSMYLRKYHSLGFRSCQVLHLLKTWFRFVSEQRAWEVGLVIIRLPQKTSDLPRCRRCFYPKLRFGLQASYNRSRDKFSRSLARFLLNSRESHAHMVQLP